MKKALTKKARCIGCLAITILCMTGPLAAQTTLSATLLWAPAAPATHRAPVQLGVRSEHALLGPVRLQGGLLLEWGNALPPLVRVAHDGDAVAHWGLGLAVGTRLRALGSWTRTDRLVAGAAPGYYVGFATGAELRLTRGFLRAERLVWTPKRWLAEPKRSILRAQWGPVAGTIVESAAGRWGWSATLAVHGPLVLRVGRELVTERADHILRPAWIIGGGLQWRSR